ncbi:ComEC/Rec2 family competence protein [Georgenia subflava]|uniref:ComEC/Rec2 family competence protein n=1 Tax=Georgenia subflava TaxID=1622177 RepID=UPI001265A0C7|nr:ComEC/Rec2 family competence protein [Georgenia subflava]
MPAALTAWAATFLGVARTPSQLTMAALVVAVLLLAPARLLLRERAAGPRPGRPGARHRDAARRPPTAASLLAGAVLVAVLVSTAAQVQVRQSGLLGELTERGASAVVTGRVATEPRALEAGAEWDSSERYRLELDVEEVAGRGERSDARAGVVLLGPAGWGEVRLGEQVSVRGNLVATEPGDDALALVVTTNAPDVVGVPPWHLRVVNLLRGALREATADLSPQAQGLVPGIAVGDDRALPAPLVEDMRITALTHLTAVSGAHVAILLGCVLGALVWLPRRWRSVAGAVALLAFVGLVRPEASVLRSAVMGAVVLAALLLGRPARALPALSAAVVLLLLVDPWLARSYGFALSVLATAGLVLLARPWARWLSRLVPRWLATALAVPAAAQATCAPVVVLLTPALSLYAVPANVLAAVAVPPATVLGVGATVLAPLWPGAAHALAVGASVCTAWIALVARFFAGLPGAQLPWPGGLTGVLCLAVATVLAVLLLARAGPRRPGAALGVLALLGLVLLLPWPRAALVARLPDGWPPEGWVAIQCDVGQGGAFLVRSGPSAAVMVDVGPADGDAAGCLTAADVHRVDLLVLTHGHVDHVGGLAEVLGAVEVRAAVLGPGAEPATTVAAVRDQLADAGVPLGRPLAGGADATGTAGSVAWEVLWPDAAAVERLPAAEAVNDLSLVVRLSSPRLLAVALGDVELAGQSGLVREMRTRGLRGTDVTVMSHHGSARQDPALAALLQPRLTLVSVGEGNDYGHPAPSALELYGAGGGLVLRTDLCGAVAVVGAAAPRDGLAVVARCPR